MNNNIGHCPACHRKLEPDRYVGQLVVCECGWTLSSQSNNVEKRMSDKVCASILAVGLFLVGSFIHVVNWDNHFFAIVPLKVKQIAGMANSAELEQIAEICIDRKKHSCVKEAYFQISKAQPNNTENLAKLAELQRRTGEIHASLLTYKTYFDRGGANMDIAYGYALSLSNAGKVDPATKYFRMVLKSKPKVLQITVTREYVKMLMDHNRLQQAARVIRYYRKLGTNTSYFLEKELRSIERLLAKTKVTRTAG